MKCSAQEKILRIFAVVNVRFHIQSPGLLLEQEVTVYNPGDK